MSENKSQFQTMLAGIALGVALLLVYVAAMGMGPAPLKAPAIVDPFVLHRAVHPDRSVVSAEAKARFARLADKKRLADAAVAKLKLDNGGTLPKGAINWMPTVLGVVVSPSGGDDTANIQAAYNATNYGPLIFVASGTNNRFIYGSPLNLTGTFSGLYGQTTAKAVGIVGNGCVLYQAFASSGTQQGVTIGGPAGMPTGGIAVHGLSVYGSLTIQNISGCHDIHLDEIIGSLNVQTDANCSYDDIYGGSITGGLIVNQLTATAWADRFNFHGSEITNNTGSAVVQQANPNASGPVGLAFYQTSHEGNMPMFLAHNNFGVLMEDTYCEGAVTTSAGTIGSGCSVQLVNTAHCNWAGPGIWNGAMNEP